MSISPAISFSTIYPASSPESPSVQGSAQALVQSAHSSAKSEKVPNAEVQTSTDNSAASPLREDEVELQRDSELENELIVRYVDKAGNLILQVPGSQMLNFQRAIAAEFQHSKQSAAAPASEKVSQSGESHGH